MNTKILGLDAYLAICAVEGIQLSNVQRERLDKLIKSKLSLEEKLKKVRDIYAT